MTNLFIGTLATTYGAYAGYVDDVRIYTSALNAHEVASLYANPPLTQTIATSSSYLPITSYVKPTLPNINAPIVDAKVSQTGQYMVAVTSGTTNNVYYSTDFGATFNALTLGSAAMTSCSISHDGSYFTVTNATTTYTLNRNSAGFTLALGSNAGQVNQANNAIAIGNLAGQTNQSANSIVLNASGTAVNTGSSGFYVSPISTTAGFPMDLLGYGSDSQVVKSGVTVLPGGIVGIGTTNPYQGWPGSDQSNIPNAMLTIRNGLAGQENGISRISIGGNNNHYAAIEGKHTGSGSTTLSFLTCTNAFTNSGNPETRMVINSNGNVGIGTTNPSSALQVVGTITAASITAPGGNYFSIANGAGSGSIGVWGNNIIIFNSSLYSGSDNGYYCGISSNRWIAIYAVNGAIQTSDSKEKDSQPLPYGINEILQMRTIKYKWKSQADLPDDDPSKNFEYYGFCADELAPLFPELVYDEDKTVPVQMNYSEILPVVVNALKEEHASAVALKSVVDAQTEQIAALQASDVALKSVVDAQTEQIKALQADLTATKASLSSVESTLASTQSDLASTQATLAEKSARLDALLAWAQAQGFSG